MVIRVLAIGFSIIGIVLLAFGYSSYTKTRAFIRDAVSAEGAVVAIVPRQRRARIGTTRYYHYRIEYRTETGSIVRFESPEGDSSQEFNVGDKLPVLYLPDEPQQAEINLFSHLWYGFTMLSVIGGSLLGCGLTLLWITAKPVKRYRTKAHIKEIGDAIRSGRLRRGSEWQPLLIAVTIIVFALLAVALLVILLGTRTAKVVMSLFLLYAVAQTIWAVLRRRSKTRKRAA
jgi:hypothetical protein